MRSCKFIFLSFFLILIAACASQADYAAESGSGNLNVVTPSSSLDASAALTAEKSSGDVYAYSGRVKKDIQFKANLAPGVEAVSDFCSRPGSLAVMTRRGCEAGLGQLVAVMQRHLHFESQEECLDFLPTLRAGKLEALSVHKEWCERTFASLHDRSGCYAAAQTFIDSLSEEGFCRKTKVDLHGKDDSKKVQAESNAKFEPKKSGLSPTMESPYIPNYREPGQKMDSPKRGRYPLPAQPDPKGGTAQKAVKNAPAAPKDNKGAVLKAADKPGVMPSEKAPVPKKQLQTEPAKAAPVSAPAEKITAPPATAVPALPAGNTPLPAPPQFVAPENSGQQLPLAPVKNSSGIPSFEAAPQSMPPSAQPAGLRALENEQNNVTPAPQGAVEQPKAVPLQVPALPASGTEQNAASRLDAAGADMLPAVPAIGRVAPALMPGVPPSADISSTTLPAAEETIQKDEAVKPEGAAPVSFGGVIPNYTPPPEEEKTPEILPLPLSGAPAGQAH